MDAEELQARTEDVKAEKAGLKKVDRNKKSIVQIQPSRVDWKV